MVRIEARGEAVTGDGRASRARRPQASGDLMGHVISLPEARAGQRRLGAASLCPKAAPRSASSSACAMSAGARAGRWRQDAARARAASRLSPQPMPDARRDHAPPTSPDVAGNRRRSSADAALLQLRRLALGSGALALTRHAGSSRARPAPSRPDVGSETMRAPGIPQNRACATRRHAPRRSGCPDRHRRHAPTAWAGVSATTSRRPFSAAEFDKAKKAPPPS